MEKGILELWRETKAFEESVLRRPADNEYIFYDGPPFPTGSPHYGNLLAGVIKDMVPRYWTMRGYRVERRFGWDTHGLPIEMEVEKRLGISGPKAIAEYGVDRFNEAARSVVQANTENWEVLTERIGRWVDFENDYKTMDPEFMETVWWVFKQLWDKGLVYKDFKVLPYSWGAATPLSNFEANKDYRDVEDPSITVRLEVLEDAGPVMAGDYLLIWTTTPWTLPGNLAVAVGEDIAYSRIIDGDEHYWIATGRATTVFGDDPNVVGEVKGSELLGVPYRPPFDYFAAEREAGAFRTISSPEVTVDEGTGLVHMAPAYGEADFYALKAAGIESLVDPVDAEGDFTDQVPEVAGQNVKVADATLIELLRASGNLVHADRITHSYPFCERTGTPLIYKAIPTWFVRVEDIRDRMVEINDTIHWVPDYVGSRRFGNWLTNARDWAISRNRYWGSCIPVWECTGCDEAVAVGSLDELESLSGQRPDRSPQTRHRRDRLGVLLLWWLDDQGSRGPRRLVRVGLDALRDAALPVRERRAIRGGLPREIHRRGPRPDPGLVLHAHRPLHRPLRRAGVRELRGQRADPCRGRAEDVQEPEELSGPLGDLRPHGRRRAARLPHQLAGASSRAAPLQQRRCRRGGPHRPSADVEHLQLLHHLRRGRRHHRRRPRDGPATG